MNKLLVILWKRKPLLTSLLFICIFRSLIVIWLNKGYASLIDNVLNNHYELIMNSAIILLCSGVIQIIVIIIQNSISSVLSEKTAYDLKTETIDSILKTEYENIDNLSIGVSLSKFNTDLSGIAEWIKSEFSALISDSTLFIIVLIALLIINWKLTVFSFCSVPFISIGSYLLSKPITATEKEKNQALSDVNTTAKSILNAFPIFKIFQMKKIFLHKLEKKINYSIQSEIKANKIRAKLMSINGFLSYIPTAIMWGYGGHMVIKGNISAGALLAFANMSNFVRAPLVNLPSRICLIRSFSANTSRFFEMLTQIKFIEHNNRRIEPNMTKENIIEFQNVSFGYSENKNNLENVSFKIYKNSSISIVGESGCGKSTILKLISGLYYADKGNVLIFGENIININIDDVRKQISFIPQEAQLFPMNIYENITCGHPVSMEKVLAACKAAHLVNFLKTLPNGIYTNIGEHGNKLSGGERQRISIARAIVKNAPIFLMDEATSALDGETEKIILNYFNELKKNHTVIYVTHKIKHAINADLILCMKNGRICESGTHDELMNANGYYSKLFKIQNMLEVISDEKHYKTV